MMHSRPAALHFFENPADIDLLPEKFTFPFSYEAHPVAVAAAGQVQNFLKHHYDNSHNFGLDPTHPGLVIGKMFGVLVVKNKENELGFLAAYSGKLDQGDQHPYFVPPVFDVFEKSGFYREEERHISALNQEIEKLEESKEYINLVKELREITDQSIREIEASREAIRQSRKIRRERKALALDLPDLERERILEYNSKESYKEKYELRVLSEKWNEKISLLKEQLAPFEKSIIKLKDERKIRSNQLQKKLFANYTFLNADQKEKSLLTIFTEELGLTPPAGAGECAAPKLLHYAYRHELQPIAMAEFWWGASPKSEVRKHTEYYPACKTKCGPILGFMLQGLDVDENPLEANPALGKQLKTLFEDEYILVVNKPTEFLSVPGRFTTDSVQSRIKEKYPEALLVHRLDQSTSGIILIAKDHETYVNLQRQFTRRTVKKRYVADLAGTIARDSGYIELPLRVDLDNRPYQLVCHDYGKPAKTRFEKIKENQGITRVHFYPITGRTHQLRVHASHPSGLNAAIVGDDLYGRRADRLHLHAAYLEFDHPVTGERVSFYVKEDF